MANQSFDIGTAVRVPFGNHSLVGTIVEDRGPIGVRGRHLYGVRLPISPEELQTIEFPAEELEPANGTEAIRRADIIEYLKRGGLVAMLQANMAGGQPAVWLCRDSIGNVTHTFLSDRGVIGGEVPPARALHNYEHVFKPKRDAVHKFLRSLELTSTQADEVLEAIGTSP